MSNNSRQTQDNKPPKQLNDLYAAYKLVFNSEDGTTILDDLRKRFHMTTPTFVAGDSHESAFLEGQRSVVLTIENMIANTKK